MMQPSQTSFFSLFCLLVHFLLWVLGSYSYCSTIRVQTTCKLVQTMSVKYALILCLQDSVMDAYFAHCKMHSKKATVHRKVHFVLATVHRYYRASFVVGTVCVMN